MWTPEMKRRLSAALPIARGIVKGSSAVPPDLWNDVITKEPEKWDALLRLLDPEAKNLEREQERLYHHLRELLPTEEASKILLKYHDAWGNYTFSECTAAYLLGVAVGQGLCAIEGRVKDKRFKEERCGNQRSRAA
jgi:hypothetical protein